MPIKFIGTGEHLDALEEFHPERMAGRILGMGDVLTLVEQAQQKFDQDEMASAGGAAPQGRVHARRLPQACSARSRSSARCNKIMGMMPGMGGMQQDDGRRRRRGGHAAAGRHHRLDDARRAPQSVAR